MTTREPKRRQNGSGNRFSGYNSTRGHPRIVDSFQDAPGFPGEIKFFTIADPAAPSIQERAADTSWDTTARLSFARDAVRALSDLHGRGNRSEPMVHRNLTPDTILVNYDNTPIFTSFEHARIPTNVSIAPPVAGRDWDPTVSPEVRSRARSTADHRADISSLCASLSAVFERLEDETSAQVLEVLALGLDDDPGRRSSLTDLETSLSKILAATSPPTHVETHRKEQGNEVQWLKSGSSKGIKGYRPTSPAAQPVAEAASSKGIKGQQAYSSIARTAPPVNSIQCIKITSS